MLTLPDGGKRWPRFGSSRLTQIAPIQQIRLVQTSLTEIEVRLQTARPLTEAETAKLSATIIENLQHPFALRFSFVDEFARTASGKFEDFQSLVN